MGLIPVRDIDCGPQGVTYQNFIDAAKDKDGAVPPVGVTGGSVIAPPAAGHSHALQTQQKIVGDLHSGKSVITKNPDAPNIAISCRGPTS